MAKKKHKKGNPGRGGTQPGAGKPKRVLTPAEKKKAGGYALDGCQNGTIEGLMDWSEGFIHEKVEIRRFLTKKRQQRKQKLRHAQTVNANKHHSNTMQVFLGVNELDQRDVKTQEVGRQTLADIAAIVGADLPVAEEGDKA